MAQPQGNLQNLAEGSEESLRALIQAIIPEAASGSSNGKLSGDAVAKLTEKLTQLMGPQAAEGFQQNRNERGELLNEEGLPIIDITEPADLSTRSIPPSVTVEPLIPLATLSPPVRERLREKRNRILDLLEEEERQSELLEQERESQERDEILRKRKEEAAKEKDKLKEARELQKKMGRALLQNMGKAKDKEQQEKEAQRVRDEEADAQRKSPSVKKKSVAFVETQESLVKSREEEVSAGLEWGDVTPARLQNTKRPTLISQSLLDKHPMKMSVVERVPGGQPTIPKSPHPIQKMVDSDDESDPGNISESSETDFAMNEEESILEDDEFDFDFAQQQREIALEYYNKRNTIGQTAAAAMMNHSHESEDHTETAPETIREGQKPVVSQFRASRIASAYGASAPGGTKSESFSLGASVLPASSTRTIQRAIKTGKLDSDGRLVGAEADSESEEEDQGMQEVLELLRKGEVYNLGPNGEYLHAVRPNQVPQMQHSTPQPSSSHVDAPLPSNNLPPPVRRPTTSKFKASLAASGRPATTTSHPKSMSSPSSDHPSPSVTPISHAGRSSPKLDASSQQMGEHVVEAGAPFTVKSPSPTKPQVQNPSPFSMIVDSPSFLRPQGSSSHTIVSSPSFPPPAQNSRRPERPPTVISATVRESTRSAASAQVTTNDDGKPDKKVSRFRAERM